MKKNLFLSLIALFCITFANAQTKETSLSNEEFFTQAEIIFEGYRIATVATYDPSGTGISDECYRINAYKVQRVYKSAQYATGDTIYMVFKGAVLGEEKYRFDENALSILPDFLERQGFECDICGSSPAVYFIVRSDFPDDHNNTKYASYDKYKIMNKYTDRNRYIGAGIYDVLFVCNDKIMGLDSLLFHQREDFYNYMRQYRGFSVPEIDREPENGTESDGGILDSEHYENKIAIPDSTPNETDKYQKKQSKKK